MTAYDARVNPGQSRDREGVYEEANQQDRLQARN
jgi:hypothetical protein